MLRELKTSERVARDIAHDIVFNQLVTGDGLAAEAKMLEQYGVSRETLREALRLLEVQGLITIRRGPGGGPIVGVVDPANLGRASTLYFHMAGATYRELFEAWAVSEAYLAERAARNPDAALRDRLMRPYFDELHLPDPSLDVALYVHAHTLFHGAIATLASNRVLELTYQTFGQVVSHHVATVVDDTHGLEALIDQDHIDLAKAIAAGRATKARSIMEVHIQRIADFLADQMGREVDGSIEWR